MPDPTVAAVVLAAGRGARFAAQAPGAFKLLAPLEGVPLVRRVVGAAVASRARPVVVVTGHRAEEVRAALDGAAVRFVHNPDFASGVASSVRAGVAAAGGVGAAVVMLADMPRVTACVVDALIDAFARRPGCDAVVPIHRGQRGNPVLLSRRLFDAVATLSGDEGARKLLARSANVVELPVEDQSVAFDVDTPDMLAR